MIKKFFKNIEAYMASILLLLMLALLTMQVCLRLFSSSNSWSEEVARYLFIWIIYLGASTAAQTGSHICISILLKIWPKVIRVYAEIIGTLMWIALNVVVVYLSAKFAWGLFVSNTISLGLHINMFYAYAAIPVGFALMTVRVILNQLIPQIKRAVFKLPEEERGEMS